jgi:hypothetical protein
VREGAGVGVRDDENPARVHLEVLEQDDCGEASCRLVGMHAAHDHHRAASLVPFDEVDVGLTGRASERGVVRGERQDAHPFANHELDRLAHVQETASAGYHTYGT